MPVAAASHSRNLSTTNVNRHRWLLPICCAGCTLILIGLMILVRDDLRYPSADTTSYLDIALSARAGQYSAFMNAYWSPLYPALLYLALPAHSLETLPQVRILCLQGILLALLVAAFGYFVAGLRTLAGDHRPALLTIVSCLFFVAFHAKMYVVTYTPDILIAIAVFWSLGIVCRLLVSSGRVTLPIALGFVLALGYWAKAAYFPASILLLSFLFFAFLKARQPLRPALIAAATFVVLSAPVIAMTSMAAGQLTFGEAGRLNYGWSVNRYQMHMGWHGTEPGSGVPLHPPHVLSEKPFVMEFAEPGAGSFPLWDNPALWHKGMQTHFSLPQLLTALKGNLTALVKPVYFWLVLVVPAFLAGTARVKTVRYLLLDYSCLWLWPLVVIGCYCLVAVETRYLAPLVVACVISLLWLCPLKTRSARTVFTLQVALIGGGSLWMLYTSLPGRPRGEELDSRWSWERALFSYLRDHGVRRGDSLANLGDIDSVLFAQPLGAQVVSWVKKPQPADMTPETWAEIQNQWRKLNITAVVSKCRDKYHFVEPVAAGTEACSPALASALGLQRIPGTPYFVMMLR